MLGNSVSHNSIHPPDFSGNHGNHQDLNGDEAKFEIFNSANSQYFFAKMSQIGFWVSRIFDAKGSNVA